MAQLHQDDSGVPDPVADADIIHQQLQQIPQIYYNYHSPRQLANVVERIVDSYTPEESYLYFRGVSMGDTEALDRALTRKQVRNSVRMTFEEISNEMIVRLRPTREHNITGAELYLALRDRIELIPGHTRHSVVGLGSTRISVLGQGSKEPDHAICPATRARANTPWPSIVIEVGYSEKQSQLRLDAQWWLIHSANQTRFVVLLHMERNPNRLHIECWSMPPPRRTARHTPSLAPRCE